MPTKLGKELRDIWETFPRSQERNEMMTEEILTQLYDQRIKKIEKTFDGDILITLTDGQVIKIIGSEHDGSVDAELENTEQARYCAICGLTSGPDGCQHAGVKYTMDELHDLEEVKELEKHAGKGEWL